MGNPSFMESSVEILTREDIEKLNKELIAPFCPECLTDVGYDLRVGEKIILLTSGEERILSEGKPIILPPQERFAVESLEKIMLSSDMFAFNFTRITLAWKGLTSLGTKVDPLFRDKLYLIFSNDSHRELELKWGDKICNIMFFRYKNPPKRMQPRSRPSGLVIPAFLEPIEEPVDFKEIRTKYGYGIYAVMRYVRPILEEHWKNIRKLERFKNKLIYIIIGIATTVISGLIVWLLTH